MHFLVKNTLETIFLKKKKKPRNHLHSLGFWPSGSGGGLISEPGPFLVSTSQMAKNYTWKHFSRRKYIKFCVLYLTFVSVSFFRCNYHSKFNQMKYFLLWLCCPFLEHHPHLVTMQKTPSIGMACSICVMLLTWLQSSNEGKQKVTRILMQLGREHEITYKKSGDSG